MLRALLERKVGASLRKSEDVLTATVFGLLSWLAPEVALGKWLTTAAPFSGSTTATVTPAGTTSQVTFWPRLDVGDGSTAEPDVLIETRAAGRSVIFIEAKLWSGPSGWPTTTDASSRVTGQLGRQWSALMRGWSVGDAGGSNAPDEAAIVYVTADWTMPRAALAAMVDEVEAKLGDAGLRRSLYWLSWRTLPAILDAIATEEGHDRTTRTIAREVAAYLREIDLDCYEGLSPPQSSQFAWIYGGGYTLQPHPPPTTAWTYEGDE